jgi:hypothetical protein
MSTDTSWRRNGKSCNAVVPVFRKFGLRSLPAQSAVKGMSSDVTDLRCLCVNYLVVCFYVIVVCVLIMQDRRARSTHTFAVSPGSMEVVNRRSPSAATRRGVCHIHIHLLVCCILLEQIRVLLHWCQSTLLYIRSAACVLDTRQDTGHSLLF